MSQNINLLTFSPIPKDYKPIKEFLLIQKNPFFSWIYLPLNLALQQWSFFFLCIFSFIFLCSILLFSLDWSTFFFTLFLSSLICFFINFLLFCKLVEIKNQLNLALLTYEEGSWYETQIWEKPFSILKNEKFLSSQLISPIFKRFNFTLFLFLFFSVLFFFFSIKINS